MEILSRMTNLSIYPNGAKLDFPMSNFVHRVVSLVGMVDLKLISSASGKLNLNYHHSVNNLVKSVADSN